MSSCLCGSILGLVAQRKCSIDTTLCSLFPWLFSLCLDATTGALGGGGRGQQGVETPCQAWARAEGSGLETAGLVSS